MDKILCLRDKFMRTTKVTTTTNEYTHTHHNACRIQNDIINTAVKTSMYDEEEESAVR